MKCLVMSFEMSVVCCDFGSLCIEAQGYVPVLLENLCGMSCLELVGPWVVLGFSVGMEAFG